MKLLNLGFALMLVPALVGGCAKEGSTEEQPAMGGVVVPVQVASIQVGNMEQVVSASGTTEALRKEIVLSPVTGTVIKLLVLEGAQVHPGELLAVIQTRESQAAIAGDELLDASAKTPEQKAEAQHALEIARSSQSFVSINTKLGGVIATRSIVEGSQVTEGAELVTMIDYASLCFQAQVYLHDLDKVTIGQRAEVIFPSVSHKSFGAVVAALSPESDPQSQTLKVRLNFTQEMEKIGLPLKDGMVGAARIIVGMHRNVMLVPRVALLRDDETNSFTIVTVTADSMAKSIPVSVDVLADSVAEISGHGLTANMPVISEGHYALADSTRVSVRRQADK